MGNAWGWTLSPGSEAADLVVPISPPTRALIEAIDEARLPCMSGDPAQDAACVDAHQAAGRIAGGVGKVLDAAQLVVGASGGSSPLGILVLGVAHGFAGGLVGNQANVIRAVRIGADAGVPGYAYGTVMAGQEPVEVYVDATPVLGGGKPQVLPDPPAMEWQADRDAYGNGVAGVVDRAQDTVHPYLGDEKGFEVAHERAMADIGPAVQAYKQPAHPYIPYQRDACDPFIGCR